MDIIIRKMKPEDLEEVVNIDKMSFSLPWPENSFRFEVLENRNSRNWVAEGTLPDGKKRIVAMTVLWKVLDEIHIGTFAVHPEFRRLGVGKQLLKVALDEARSEGASHAWLEVRRSNLAAQQLYQQFGFEVLDVRKKYYKDNGEDALVMTGRL
jgi:[ribosomal protein S18]-alanine N-acetyltransferase